MISIDEFVLKVNGEVLRYGDCDQLNQCEIDASRVTKGGTYLAINPTNYDCTDGGLGLTGNEDSVFGLGGFDDGHQHVQLAINNGASIVVIEDALDLQTIPKRTTVIKCPKSIYAGVFLANTLLSVKRIRVIGVSGCIGKTTTSHAIWSCLNKLDNNTALLFDRTRTTYLGLAIDILRHVDNQKYLVVELQSDGRGQIPKLLEVAPPEISVVTRITYAHYVKLGSLDRIVEEEASPLILPEFRRNVTAIINGDDISLSKLCSNDWKKRILFGKSHGCDTEIVDSTIEDDQTNIKLRLKGRNVEFSIGHIGAHYPYTFASAITVLIELGYPEDIVVEIIQQCSHEPGRMEIFKGIKDCLVLVDAYNAGFESMLSALETLKAIGPGKKIGIIGSMLELGRHCRLEHEKLGESLFGKLDVLIAVGEAAYITANSAALHGFSKDSIFHFESVERLILSLSSLPIPAKSHILIKGSGALRLERVALHMLAETVS